MSDYGLVLLGTTVRTYANHWVVIHYVDAGAIASREGYLSNYPTILQRYTVFPLSVSPSGQRRCESHLGTKATLNSGLNICGTAGGHLQQVHYLHKLGYSKG